MTEVHPQSTTRTPASATPDVPKAADTDRTYALLLPDGTLEWRSDADHDEVRKLVGGYFGPDQVTTAWLGPGCQHATGVLRLMASDLCLTGHYEANNAARRVITELSRGYVSQRWGGIVALVEYERDADMGEVLFPQPMSDRYLQRIEALYSLSHASEN